MLSYEVHFYFSEATTHVSSVKTLIGSNHMKVIGRQGTDVCFAFMEGLTPVNSLNENGANFSYQTRVKD